MKFKEVELKLNANEVSLDDFKRVMGSNAKWFECGSHDDYFSNGTDQLLRYRYNIDRHEFTIKNKIGTSNTVRDEVNLLLDPKHADSDGVRKFCSLLGYEYSFTIYKQCWIANVDDLVYVYYVVYDRNMKEVNRFVEIEADEEHDWLSEETAYTKVIDAADTLISCLPGLKKEDQSIFEMFRSN